MTDSSVEAVARAICGALYGPLEDGSWAVLSDAGRDSLRRCAEAAIAALPSPEREPMREAWQPIESAPQGCMCLFADMTATQARDRAFVDWMAGASFVADHRRTATHWMPLPAPPTAQSGDRT